MLKVFAIFVAILSAIYAGAVHNGHEPSTASVILDQALISALFILWAWSSEK